MVEKSVNGMDRLGIAASALCAIHCMLVALVPAGLLVGSLAPFLSHEVEWAICFFTGFIALGSAALGFRSHGSPRIIAMLLAGVGALMGARFLEEVGVEGVGLPLGILGSVALVTGHLLNMKACRSCHRCC